MNVERLEHKLGIRASDTATIRFENCRVPAENLLGSPEVDPKQGFAGAMATFDNTRPLVAAMAVGCARASLDLTRELLEQAGVEVDYDRPAITQSAAAARFLQMEADWEAAHLLTLQAAWMADNRQAELARGLDGQGEGRPGGLRHHARLRGARRLGRLQRDRAAREVGARLQDPRHLRGHPADPAADRRPPDPGALERRAQVPAAGGGPPRPRARRGRRARGTRCRRRERPAPRSGRAAGRRCLRCVRRANAAAGVRPRSRSTRAQVSSRSRPTTGRSSTVTATSAGSRPTSRQCACSTSILRSRVSGSDGTLIPSASRAAIRRVRRSPPPPTMTGMRPTGRGYDVVSGSRTRSPSYAFVPGAHSARIVSIAASSVSSRSPAPGKGRPYAACSRSHQPAPMPDERPPAGQRVEGGGGLGGDPRRTERHRRHEGAEAQSGPEPREQAERHPGLRDRLPGTADLGDLDQVVHQREPREPGLVGGERDPGQPGGRVLAPREPGDLQHDAQPLRRASLAVRLRRRAATGAPARRPSRPRARPPRRARGPSPHRRGPRRDGGVPLSCAGEDRGRDRTGPARRCGAGTRRPGWPSRRPRPGGRRPGRPPASARGGRRRSRACRPPWSGRAGAGPSTIAFQQVERVGGGVQVVRAAADHRPERVGGDDLLAAGSAPPPTSTCRTPTARPGRRGRGRAARSLGGRLLPRRELGPGRVRLGVVLARPSPVFAGDSASVLATSAGVTLASGVDGVDSAAASGAVVFSGSASFRAGAFLIGAFLVAAVVGGSVEASGACGTMFFATSAGVTSGSGAGFAVALAGGVSWPGASPWSWRSRRAAWPSSREGSSPPGSAAPREPSWPREPSSPAAGSPWPRGRGSLLRRGRAVFLAAGAFFAAVAAGSGRSGTRTFSRRARAGALLRRGSRGSARRCARRPGRSAPTYARAGPTARPACGAVGRRPGQRGHDPARPSHVRFRPPCRRSSWVQDRAERYVLDLAERVQADHVTSLRWTGWGVPRIQA